MHPYKQWKLSLSTSKASSQDWSLQGLGPLRYDSFDRLAHYDQDYLRLPQTLFTYYKTCTESLEVAIVMYKLMRDIVFFSAAGSGV